MADTGAQQAFKRVDQSALLPGEENAVRIEGELKVRNPCPQTNQIMLGGTGIGCMFKDTSPEAAKATIDRAVELGIRYMDTAPWYGAGLSESRFGEALKGRTDVLVSTKCGRIIVPKDKVDPQVHQVEGAYEGAFITDAYHNDIPCADYTGDGVREAFRQSSERLQSETIYNFRLHDAETPDRFAVATAPGGAIEAMIALKAEGKVKELSLGMNSARHILALLRMYPGTFNNIMLSNAFTLIDHDCRDLMMTCQAQGVKIHNVGIFCSGLLWGGSHYAYSSSIPEEVKAKVEKWKDLAKKHGLTLPQLALNFAFLPEIVEYCGFGTSRPVAVDENLALCGATVPVALWKEAKAAGLIEEWVPVPSGASGQSGGRSKAQREEYVSTKLTPLLEPMVADVLREMPENPKAFMVAWIQKNAAGGSAPAAVSADAEERTLAKQTTRQSIASTGLEGTEAAA